MTGSHWQSLSLNEEREVKEKKSYTFVSGRNRASDTFMKNSKRRLVTTPQL